MFPECKSSTTDQSRYDPIYEVKRYLIWSERDVGDPGNSGTNPITVIAFSCAVIHYPVVYNLKHHLSYQAYMVCKVKDPFQSVNV